jgi:hypothetical protein
MKRTWTIIGVGDVPGGLKWYQALFGQPATVLVSTAQPDKKKACAEKTSNSWMCSAM